MVIVKVLEEVRLTVTVQIVQPDDLIATGDKQLVATEFYPERLKEPARHPAPAERSGGGGHETVHAPDVAIPSRHDGSPSVRRAIEPARAHPAFPRVFYR